MTSQLLKGILSRRQAITSIGEVVEKKEPSFTAVGNVNWSSNYGKQCGSFVLFCFELRIELPYDPAIPFLHIYLKNLKTFIHTPMFIVALFTVAKTWKEPQCPSVSDGMKKMWDTYTVDYYSATRDKVMLPFATRWMDLANIMLSKINQSVKAKNHLISLICGV